MKNDGIILFGSTGLLGAHVLAILQTSEMHRRVYAFSSANVNFGQANAVQYIIKTIRPSVVINCAAWTDVDGCESNPELADAINARSVHEMALACAHHGARFVHVSTDFVYTGNEEEKPPYREFNPPIMYIGRDVAGVYARTKYSGEAFAAMAPNHCIIRTSWLFGQHPKGRKTFPEWFLDSTLATIQAMRAAEQSGASYRKMPLLTDRYGSPSYAPDVAQAIVMLAAAKYIGPAHVVNDLPLIDIYKREEGSTPFGYSGSQEDFGGYAIRTFAESQAVKTGLMNEIARDFDKIFVRQTQADLIASGAWKIARPTDTRLLPTQLGGFVMRPFDEALAHFWKTRTSIV